MTPRRIAALALAALALAVAQAAVLYSGYHTKVWNGDHTEIYTGWEAARYLSFLFNAVIGVFAFVAGMAIAAITLWKTGRRA